MTPATEFVSVAGSRDPGAGPGLALGLAYVAMWVLALGFVWLTYRRQQRLAAHVSELERSLPKSDE